MNSSDRYSYSPNSPDLAVSTVDGRLVVYDTSLSAVKTEYVPSSHLQSAACTCVAWRPPKEFRGSEAAAPGTPGKRSRKRKSSLSSSCEKLNGSSNSQLGISDQIALGTTSGSIVLYSVKTSEVKKTHDKAHSDRINGIAWADSGLEVFTCSSDGCVGRLSMTKSSFSKFRPEGFSSKKRQGLFSLALHPSQSSALLGATAQVLWIDLDTKSTLRSFSAHLHGDVMTLQVFGGATTPHVLIGGVGDKDRVVSVWKLEASDGQDSNVDDGRAPAAIFDTNDSVKSAFAAADSPSDGDWILGAVTKSGVMHCFRFNVDDPATPRKKRGKPIKPKSTIQVASDKDTSTQKVTPIPILAGKVAASPDAPALLYMLHGSHAKPAFETLHVDKLDKLTVLVRNVGVDPTKRQMGAKIMIPDTTSVNVVTRTSLIPSSNSGTKRKSSSDVGKVDDLPMLERLRLLSRETEHITTPPRTDSLLQLLLQGLHNRDRKILDSVLDRADIELIDKTVCKLPVEGVIPLINELQHYIKGRGMVNQSHAKWLRSVLQHHSSYLMASAHCDELLGPIVAMLQARTKHFAPLINLKGKLDVMTRQIRARPEDSDAEKGSVGTELNAANEARLVYQDDSSDNMSDVLDELLPPASDTEEQWNLDEVDDDSNNSGEGDEMEAEGSEDDSGGDSDGEEKIVNGEGSMAESDDDGSGDAI